MRRIFVSFLLLLAGCASWNEVMHTWIGNPFEDIRNFWGPADQVWGRSDGKIVHMYHLRDVDPDCMHFWIVDPSGIIEDFYYKGDCVPM